MNERVVSFTHFPLGTGRVTCAIDHPCNRTVPGIVNVGISFCSPKDVFVKARGRQKALGRLNSKGSMTFSFHSVADIPFKAQVLDLLLAMRDGLEIPQAFNVKVGLPNWAYRNCPHKIECLLNMDLNG